MSATNPASIARLLDAYAEAVRATEHAATGREACLVAERQARRALVRFVAVAMPDPFEGKAA